MTLLLNNHMSRRRDAADQKENGISECLKAFQRDTLLNDDGSIIKDPLDSF